MIMTMTRRAATPLRPLLLSFEGRITRARFWLGFVIYVLASSVIYAFAVVTASLWPRPDQPHETLWTIAFVCGALLAIIGMLNAFAWLLAVGTKRLHDRAKSGAWMLVFIVPYWGLEIASDALGDNRAIAIGLSIAGWAFGVWALVELGLLRGTDGPNQYGDDPLATSAQ